MSYLYGARPRFNRSSGPARPRRSFTPRRGASKRSISPSRYVQAAQPQAEVVPYVATNQFTDFGLQDILVKNVQHHGYTTPTEIQDRAMPALLNGQDVIGIAQTGTGKTAAFLLPLLNKVLLDNNQGVLILAPTRELALQIAEEFSAFARNLPISASLCIGGANINTQMRQLQDNPHFVIGTPGRIKDLLQRRSLDLNMFTNIVLDEVDRMLDIGFRQDITYLIGQLPEQRQAAFFSATMNSDTDSIARRFLTNPVMIKVVSQVMSHQIEQDIVRLQPGQNKVDVLHDLLIQEDFKKVIVFGRTKHGIAKLEEMLIKRGFRVSSIHGNKSQPQRQRSLNALKQGRVQALLATDVAARGIDIEDVTHVINYDEPESYEDYVHRIGRTGRAGKVGKALTFVV